MSDDWIPVSGVLYKVSMNRCLDVVEDVGLALGGGKRIAVIARRLDQEAQTSLTTRKGGGYRLFVAKELRPGIETGSIIDVELKKDPRGGQVDLPADLHRAIEQRPGAIEGFIKATPSTIRQLVKYVDGSKKEETRSKRVQEAIEHLVKL